VQLAVGQLDEYLAKRDEKSHTYKLGQFSVDDAATTLSVTDGPTGANFSLDESGTNALTKYLKVPAAYYKKLDPGFRASVLRYEFEKNAEVDTTIETINKEIVALHQPHQVMLPLARVAEVITKTFAPEDSIRRMVTNDSRFHIDVTTSKHAMSFVPDNQAVGDVTEAGVRILAYPFKSVQPSVNLYAERLTCLNGQTTDERLGRINLKGQTVDDIITEMETAAQLVLSQADDYLTRLSATRTLWVPGSPQAFVAQLAKEMKVSRQILDAVLDIINQIPEPVSVWDVNQAFTSVANQLDHYPTMVKLQTLGGSLAFDAEKMIERCGTCERLL
jgi:hypothetical protein